MSRMLFAPGCYVQGAGAIKEIGLHTSRIGSCALVIGGKTALSLCGADILASCAEKGITCHQECFQGVSTQQEIRRLTGIGAAYRADIIIALGGGAAIDAGKAVSHEMKLPVIVVPTVISTDAPCSALSVLYSEDGVFDRYLLLRKNPECVLVDTNLVARSPVKFLVAGMGDALATFWESDTCFRSGKPNPLTGGSQSTLATRSLARLCYETLRESGFQAKLAVERNVVTPAVESIVEANTLLSGLSSENGGHAGAHSIHNGLTILKTAQQKLHGEKVAFGVLAQQVLEGRPSSAIKEVQDFCSSVGLPLCLEDLDIINPTPESIRQVAEAAVVGGETIHSTWFTVSADMVEAAIWTADALGKSYKRHSADE
ncbi:MAG: glycerol dehydrogenase [Desulfuromonadaceae bacterium]|nr:glycerol dehydrogenase [Desulfuromonadaceae bacterium]MDD5104971.1 glycerol dehydrogenase [Desulfuromonadaceae bacterium]